jgi:hypothetical protein
MSNEEMAAVQTALDRGVELFDVDRAAWVTTDDMLERLGRRDVPIKGWIVERDAERALVVTYYGDGPSGPVAWYSGRVRDGKVIAGELYPETSRPALTAQQLRLKAAADTARAFTEYEPCTPAPFNLAMIPPSAPDAPVDAYLLSAQTERGVYPLGGHYRLTLADGKLVSHRRFMKSCVNMASDAASKEHGAPAALIVSHLLDPTPTEIHVFMSIWTRKPIYVMTPESKALWVVHGGQIDLLKRD